MDPFSIVAGGAWWLGPPMAFALGMALGLSPFGWPVLALAIGARGATTPGRDQRVPSADGGTRRAVDRKLNPTILGMALAVVLVYAALGFVTDRLDAVLRVGIGSVAGILYAVVAVAALCGGVALLYRPALLCRVTDDRPTTPRGPIAGFVVGLPLAIVNCPSCAVVLTSVALAAGATGSTTYSVVAMTALGLGHGAALLVGGIVLMRPFEQELRVADTVRRIGAVLLIGVGVWYAVQAYRYGLAIEAPLA